MLIRTAMAVCLILLVACGQETSVEAPDAAAAPATTTQTPAAEPAAAPARRPSPPGAMAYIIAPADGAVVSSPVHVVFGLKGAGIAPAGTVREGTGHHHLLIDADLPDLNAPIPNDAMHRHFGGGQTEADIELAPGKHTLELLLGDDRHIPHDPPVMSRPIAIEVR